MRSAQFRLDDRDQVRSVVIRCIGHQRFVPETKVEIGRLAADSPLTTLNSTVITSDSEVNSVMHTMTKQSSGNAATVSGTKLT